MFFKIGILKHFSNFTGKHLCRSLFLNVAGLKACNCTKKKLQNRCFPVKFAKFLRTTLAATSEFCSSSCIITASVSITRFISNECIKVNTWSIVWYYINSKIMMKLVNRSSKNVSAYALLSLLSFQTWFHSDPFQYFWISRYLLSVNTSFFIDETCMQWNLNTKVKIVHELFHVSWNAPETVIHEMLWK